MPYGGRGARKQVQTRPRKVARVLNELLTGIITLVTYYVVMAGTLYGLRKLTGLSGELYRKLFHLAVAGSIFVLLYAFQHWYVAVLAILVFGVLLLGVALLFERLPRITRALSERKPGEIRSSLLLMLASMAGMIALGWGLFGADAKCMTAAPVMAWGLGDAAAALIGKRWGRRKFTQAWLDNKKSVEGTAAMFAFAAAAILATLLAYTGWAWYTSLMVAVVVAPVAAFTELVSKDGTDTITVPLATWAWLLVVVNMFGVAATI